MIWSAVVANGLASASSVAAKAQAGVSAQAAFWTKIVNVGGDFLVNLAVGVVILVVTVWLAGWASRIVHAAIGRMHRKTGAADPTLQIFAGSVARNVVLVVGLVAVLQQLGVRTTSIIAVLGAASLAIGLALQGALSNVASGVMILLFRPYRVGDIIETAGRTGRVRSLDLFVTELATLDNLKVVIPNGKLFGDVIVNHTFHDKRRADVIFRAPLSADLPALLERLKARVASDRRIFKDPPPLVEIVGMAEAYVEIAVRPWVEREDYGRVKADLLLCAGLLEKDPSAALPTPKAPDSSQPEIERSPVSPPAPAPNQQ